MLAEGDLLVLFFAEQGFAFTPFSNGVKPITDFSAQFTRLVTRITQPVFRIPSNSNPSALSGKMNAEVPVGTA